MAARDTSTRLPAEAEATGEERSSPRVEVGLARKLGVEPLKALGSFQEQWRRSGPHARRERDLTPEQLHMRHLQLVWRRGLGQRQKLERALEDAGMQARLGSGKRTPHPLRGIARQNDRAMQERGCRGQAAARLRAAGGLLERRGDRLAGPRCGCGQMPRATVGVDAAVGRLCQGQMDLPALLSGRCSVYGGAHQRMTEGHALSEREQPVRLRVHGGDRDPESLGCSQQQQRIADRLSRRDQQQTSRVVGERLNPTNEAFLDSPCEPLRLDQAEAARQLPCRQASRELEQRQRVPVRLGDDPVADSAHPT